MVRCSHNLGSEGNARRPLTKGMRRGFSLAESILSIVLVSGLLVVSMNIVGASKTGQRQIAERGVGQLLAAGLMSEIMAKPYEDPDDNAVLGLELGELGANRSGFDDVDDYHGWNESPPKLKDGTVMAERVGWRRTVAVDYVDPADLSRVLLVDQGAKRITVRVTNQDREIANVVGIRTGSDGSGVVLDPELIQIN